MYKELFEELILNKSQFTILYQDCETFCYDLEECENIEDYNNIIKQFKIKYSISLKSETLLNIISSRYNKYSLKFNDININR
jgi:hypothetical protein